MSQTQTSQRLQKPSFVAIPPAKSLFAIRFQRHQQFRIEVLARNADEAYAEAIRKFQTDEGRAQLLHALLDYFTAENITMTKGE